MSSVRPQKASAFLRGLFLSEFMPNTNHEGEFLARTNYSYEKRQKELAKKKKKEEKRLRKQEKQAEPESTARTACS